MFQNFMKYKVIKLNHLTLHCLRPHKQESIFYLSTPKISAAPLWTMNRKLGLEFNFKEQIHNLLTKDKAATVSRIQHNSWVNSKKMCFFPWHTWY